jgi:hypothetical protein
LDGQKEKYKGSSMNNIVNNHKNNFKAYGCTGISLKTETGLKSDSYNKGILNNT